MAIAFDAQSFKDITSTDSFTHTPVGTPKAVWVGIAQTTASTDRITGVTYGGVAMTRVATNGIAQDTAGEPGAVYQYFLGSGIPTGAQTVAVTVGAGIEAKTVWCATFTAASNTAVMASGKVEGDVANPSVTIATPSSFAGAVCNVLYSGAAAPADATIAAGSGYTKLTGSASGGRDFGAQAACAEYRTGLSGANVASGWTTAASSDDVAMVAAAIFETAVVQTLALSFNVNPNRKAKITWVQVEVPASTLVMKYHDLSYTVKAQVVKTLAVSYNVIKRIPKTLATSYNVKQQVAKTQALSYNVKKQIPKTQALSYNIASLGPAFPSVPILDHFNSGDSAYSTRWQDANGWGRYGTNNSLEVNSYPPSTAWAITWVDSGTKPTTYDQVAVVTLMSDLPADQGSTDSNYREPIRGLILREDNSGLNDEGYQFGIQRGDSDGSGSPSDPTGAYAVIYKADHVAVYTPLCTPVLVDEPIAGVSKIGAIVVGSDLYLYYAVDGNITGHSPIAVASDTFYPDLPSWPAALTGVSAFAVSSGEELFDDFGAADFVSGVRKSQAVNYNVKKQIAKTAALSFNIRITVAKTVALSYNVKTQIAKTLATSYNVKAQVAKTVAPSYNVRVRVAKTQALSYTIRVAVAKTVGLIWSDVGRIVKTLTPAYNVIARLQRTVFASYNVRAFVTKTVAPSYNVRRTVTKTVAVSYTVKKAIVKTVTPSYNVNGVGVAKTLSLNYNVKTQVAKTVAPSYNVRRQIAKTTALSYTARQAITKTAALSFNVRAQVTKTATPSYNVRTAVAKGQGLSYNVKKSIAKTNAMNFNILTNTARKAKITWVQLEIPRGLILSSFSPNYNIRRQVAKSVTPVYNVRAFVAKTVTPAYSVQTSYVQKSQQFVYRKFRIGIRGLLNYWVSPTALTKTPVVKTQAFSYNVRVTTAKTLVPAYTVRLAVAKTTAFSYTVKAAVVKTVTPAYNVKAQVLKTRAFNYIVPSRTPVKSTTFSYSVIGRFSKSQTFNYNIQSLATVIKSQILSYNVRRTVSTLVSPNYMMRVFATKTLTPSYTVRKAVTKTLTPSYTIVILGTVAKSQSFSYILQAHVLKTVTPTYNLRGTIARTLFVSYSLHKSVSQTFILTYNIQGSATKTLRIGYTMGAKLGSPVGSLVIQPSPEGVLILD